MGASRGRLLELIPTREVDEEVLSPEIGRGEPWLPTLCGDALALVVRKSIYHLSKNASARG